MWRARGRGLVYRCIGGDEEGRMNKMKRLWMIFAALGAAVVAGGLGGAAMAVRVVYVSRRAAAERIFRTALGGEWTLPPEQKSMQNQIVLGEVAARGCLGLIVGTSISGL